MKRSICVVVLSTVMFALPIHAQETQAPDRQPEEIIVTSDLTPARLRFQLERAQEDVYGLFNSLLEDNAYKINCVSRSSTSSHIVRRSCEPAFLANARARVAAQTMAAWRSGAGDPQLAMEMAFSAGRVSDSDLQFDIADQYEKMNQAMFDLAVGNPELQQALLRLSALQQSYSALSAQQPKNKQQAGKPGGLACLFRKCDDY